MEIIMQNIIYKKFLDNVLIYSNNIALIYKDKEYTYTQLNNNINIIADNLLKLGLDNNSIVAINLKKNSNYIAVIFALIKVGCCYVPLCDKYPKKRIISIIEASQAKYIISDNNDDYGVENIHIGALTSACKITKKCEDTCNELAYILFTSGTTGSPKGIQIFKRSVINLIDAMENNLIKQFKRQTVIGMISEMVFDVSVGQMYLALLTGNTLVLFDDSVKMDFRLLANEIQKHNVDILDFTPTHLSMYLKYFDDKVGIQFPHDIVSAGEHLPVWLVKKMYSYAEAEKTLIHNYYGPTETCVYASCYTIDRYNAEKLDKMFIGNPLKNTEMFILSSNGERCLPEEIGEICIAGEGLAKGYINNKELTEEFFVEDKSICHQRFYKTGDYGKLNKNGLFECIGRKDSQVKFHGYRIELSEIENIVNKLPDIEENHIMLQQDEDESYIVAYFVSPKEVKLEYLIKELKKVLPDYMIPSFFVRVDYFPITINGKMDKKSLPDYKIFSLRPEKKGFEIELSQKQQIVLNICREALNYDNIDIYENLAFYGLNSLMIFRMILKIDKILGVEITINEMKNVKSVDDILSLIDKKEKKRCIKTYQLKENYECTTFQKVIISLEKVANNKRDTIGKDHFPTYNMVYEINCDKTLDLIRLQRSIEQVCNNSIFEVNFKQNGSMHFNEKRNRNIVKIIEFEEFKRTSLRDCAMDFDIENQELIQILICCYDNNTKMIINVHHAIFDYLSIQNFIREIFNIYCGGTSIICNNKYFLYIEQRRKSIDEAVQFWKKYYVGRKRCNQIAGDLCQRSRSKPDDIFEDYVITKDIEWVQEYIQRIANKRITLFEVLICAWAKLLSCYSGVDDVIVGTYLPGRIIKQHTFYDSLGCYLNAIGFRFFFKENEDILEVIDRFRKDYALSEPYQYVSYFDVANQLDKSDLLKGELIGTMFNYVTFDEFCVEGIDIRIKEIGLEPETHPITIKIFDYANELVIKLKYNSNIYSKEFIQEIMDKYMGIVCSVL